MAVNMLMRYGMRRMAKGGKSDAHSKQAQQAKKQMRSINRIRKQSWDASQTQP